MIKIHTKTGQIIFFCCTFVDSLLPLISINQSVYQCNYLTFTLPDNFSNYLSFFPAHFHSSFYIFCDIGVWRILYRGPLCVSSYLRFSEELPTTSHKLRLKGYIICVYWSRVWNRAVRLTTNVPVPACMARDVMILMWANQLQAPLKSGGLWKSRLVWALKYTYARAQKTLDFQGPLLLMALVTWPQKSTPPSLHHAASYSFLRSLISSLNMFSVTRSHDSA